MCDYTTIFLLLVLRCTFSTIQYNYIHFKTVQMCLMFLKCVLSHIFALQGPSVNLSSVDCLFVRVDVFTQKVPDEDVLKESRRLKTVLENLFQSPDEAILPAQE